MIELELPYPPSLNHYWRRVGSKTLISSEGRQFRQAVLDILAVSGQPEVLTGPLAIEIEFHPPNRMRRDIDNSLKALLDAMEHGGVYHNDNQIVELTAYKRPPVGDSKTIVRIRELDDG